MNRVRRFSAHTAAMYRAVRYDLGWGDKAVLLHSGAEGIEAPGHGHSTSSKSS